MKLTLEVRPEAYADLNEAYEWYESKGEGLGLRFLGEVQAAYALILEYPTAFQVVYEQVRHFPLWRFPYAIFYEAQKDRVQVVACVHAKQDNGIWKRRT